MKFQIGAFKFDVTIGNNENGEMELDFKVQTVKENTKITLQLDYRKGNVTPLNVQMMIGED